MLVPSIPADVLRYLDKYQVKSWYVETNLTGPVKNIIVIPALSEYENIRILLANLKQNNREYLKKTLILFVVNNISIINPEVKENNLRTIIMLKSIIKKEDTADMLISEIANSEMNLGLIDASSEGMELPEREGGVGFARKIGMDLALTFFAYDAPGKNIIICLDADCRVEPNYLEAITKSFNEQVFSAACIKFRHLIGGTVEEQLAICCYEIFLRYYVLGLKFAGSVYAFNTVGSSMACDHNAYIKSEGMNKLKAAEDFYFLEKLAKNFYIGQINNTVVFPSSRGSWRVPFGTGQRVNRFLSHKQNEYLLYNPESFSVLKSWLELFNSQNILSAEAYIEEAYNIHQELKLFLELQNFRNSWERIHRFNKNEVQINRQKTIWFDGFRTLKLIHHLRDTAFPLVNMFDAVDSLIKHFKMSPIIHNSDISIPSLEIQLEYLELLRRLT